MQITYKMQAEAELLDVGQTVRLNHEDCGAGEDTRARLYLTRPDNSPNIVLCYCHNCQEHAVIRGKQQAWRDTWSGSKQPSGGSFSIPLGMSYDWDDWPPAAQAWFIKAGVSKSLASWYGVAYHPTYDRIYLPIYQRSTDMRKSANLLGYQLRSLDRLNSPKYLTALKSNDQSYYTRLCQANNNEHPDWIVIVEDLLSGLKLLQACAGWPQFLRIDVLVNYGVKVNLDALQDNRDAKAGYLVWLDNDGVNIHERANEIARTWQLITRKPCYIESTRNDPKHYDMHTVRKILEDRLGLNRP